MTPMFVIEAWKARVLVSKRGDLRGLDRRLLAVSDRVRNIASGCGGPRVYKVCEAWAKFDFFSDTSDSFFALPNLAVGSGRIEQLGICAAIFGSRKTNCYI